ncbi:hypothetical protein BHM03_00008622 [Ensete ventricosum]|nr:hypothetical protein BHM03_00008622 [Ensete ventricosum]
MFYSMFFLSHGLTDKSMEFRSVRLQHGGVRGQQSLQAKSTSYFQCFWAYCRYALVRTIPNIVGTLVPFVFYESLLPSFFIISGLFFPDIIVDLLMQNISPYIGRRLSGKVLATFVRGNLVFSEGSHAPAACGSPILAK